KELGKQLKKTGMLVVQDQVWNRVIINRAAHKSTRYYIDEMHLLLNEEQNAAYIVQIWKRFRKWGGMPTGITRNARELLSSHEGLDKQLKNIGMLVVQDQVWNRFTINRAAHKSTRYYIDEMHLLLKEEQTAAYTVEIWKRFRKWGGIPTGITQNVKDLLSSRE